MVPLVLGLGVEGNPPKLSSIESLEYFRYSIHIMPCVCCTRTLCIYISGAITIFFPYIAVHVK